MESAHHHSLEMKRYNRVARANCKISAASPMQLAELAASSAVRQGND